jgi:hypothetical protein
MEIHSEFNIYEKIKIKEKDILKIQKSNDWGMKKPRKVNQVNQGESS